MSLDIWDLKTGEQIILESGSIAEVLTPTEDGAWILVKYIDSPEFPDIVGTEDLCSAEEIVSLVA